MPCPFRAGLLLISLLCLVAVLPAWGRKEKAPIVQVTGIVRLVGSANFPELVITGTEREWYINSEERFLFMDLQHREITVEGNETVTELRFASGISAGERRLLKNVKLISIKEYDPEEN